jgi:predicted nucleic acid-binding protein
LFANRYTAFIDACTLASALRRNLLLTLAEAEFFRVRWSVQVLDETQRAIEKILADKGYGADDASDRAARARQAMEMAFEEAIVEDFQDLLCACEGMPDPDDVHVLAAALRTQAATIVTENQKIFPNMFWHHSTSKRDLRTLLLLTPLHLIRVARLRQFAPCGFASSVQRKPLRFC